MAKHTFPGEWVSGLCPKKLVGKIDQMKNNLSAYLVAEGGGDQQPAKMVAEWKEYVVLIKIIGWAYYGGFSSLLILVIKKYMNNMFYFIKPYITF